MTMPQGRRRDHNARHAAGPPAVEEIEARAARLGITPERVLEEYARIAFADLRRIVEWDEKGMKLKSEPGDDMAGNVVKLAAARGGRPDRTQIHAQQDRLRP